MSQIKRKDLCSILDVLSGLLIIASMILYVLFCRAGTSNPAVYAALAGALLLTAITLFAQKGWTIWCRILRAMCLALAIGLFVASAESVLSFTDYIFKIDYWGNAELVPQIIRTAVFMLLGLICSLVTCFSKNAQ